MDNMADAELSNIEIDDELVGELDRAGTPIELITAAEFATMESLPKLSRDRYNGVFNDFQKWKASKSATSNSERVLLAYFSDMAKRLKPSSVWAKYSMLKATMKVKDNIDIATYNQLTGFLKTNAIDYKPAKANTFKEEEMGRFLNEAPDELWLDVKVACVFGICGACRSCELPAVEVGHLEKHDEVYLVTIPVTKTKIKRSFTICGLFVKIVQKYADLRPNHVKHNRFFLNYTRGKCTAQAIGKNKFYAMARLIAMYLELADPERYTGHSLRRTSATICANAGAPIEMLKKLGGWQSTKVAESHVDDSLHYKQQTSELIISSINKKTNASATSTSNALNHSIELGVRDSLDISKLDRSIEPGKKMNSKTKNVSATSMSNASDHLIELGARDSLDIPKLDGSIEPGEKNNVSATNTTMLNVTTSGNPNGYGNQSPESDNESQWLSQATQSKVLTVLTQSYARVFQKRFVIYKCENVNFNFKT